MNWCHISWGLVWGTWYRQWWVMWIVQTIKPSFLCSKLKAFGPKMVKKYPGFGIKKNFDLRSLVILNTNLNWAWWSFWHVCHLTLSLHKWLNLNWAEPQRGVKTCPKSTKNTFPAKQIKDVVDLKSNSVLKSNKAHNLCHQFLSISY